MAVADRLLVGSVVALAGFVLGEGLLATPRGPAAAGRAVAAPDVEALARVEREYDAMVAGMPEGAEAPAWLRALHVRRLATAPADTGAGGASAADVARAVAGAGARTYLPEMIREQDSTVMRWGPGARRIRLWVATPSGPDSLAAAPGYVRAAFRVWNETPTGVAFEPVGDSATADVHVTWAPSLGAPEERGGAGRAGPVQVGHTVRFAAGGGWVVAAHVVLTTRGDLAAIQNAALHEAGHVLGLGHSPERADQMAAITDGRRFGLTDADRATARALYALPPGRVRGEE